MNIPTTLANELILYLKQQANKGDLEAESLLTQLEHIASAPPITKPQAMEVLPLDTPPLGC